jgi:hypothetical protein
MAAFVASWAGKLALSALHRGFACHHDYFAALDSI